MRFEVGDRVQRRKDVFDNESPMLHGCVVKAYSRWGTRFGDYPELFDVRWDGVKAVEHGFLPNGIVGRSKMSNCPNCGAAHYGVDLCGGCKKAVSERVTVGELRSLGFGIAVDIPDRAWIPKTSFLGTKYEADFDKENKVVRGYLEFMITEAFTWGSTAEEG